MDNQLKQLETFIETVVCGIVSQPQKVELHFSTKEDADRGEVTVINIKVAVEDIPVCIGAGGSTADSIRRLAVLASRQIGYEKALFVRVDAPRMPNNHFDFEGK